MLPMARKNANKTIPFIRVDWRLIVSNTLASSDPRDPPTPGSRLRDCGLLESRLTQKVYRLGAANARTAMGDHLFARIEFAHALRKITEWDQVTTDVADLIFVRLAHIENEIDRRFASSLRFSSSTLISGTPFPLVSPRPRMPQNSL